MGVGLCSQEAVDQGAAKEGSVSREAQHPASGLALEDTWDNNAYEKQVTVA